MPSLSIPQNDTASPTQSPWPIYTRPKIVHQALRLMEKSIRDTPLLTSPQAVRDYLRLRLADRPHEVFGVLFLTAQNQVIEFVEMFRGTLTQTSVYPREVVIEALSRNAAAVILSHYVARNIMRLMCPVFLCGRALETWHTAMVSKHWLGT